MTGISFKRYELRSDTVVKMKRNIRKVPSTAVYSRRRANCFATIVITFTSIIITPVLTMPTASTNSFPHKPCESDYECPDNFYCYTRRSPQQYCAPCYMCSRLNREAAINNGCAKSRTECGSCLRGYHDLGIICSRIPDGFGQENYYSNARTQAEPTKTAGSWWILWVVGAAIAISVVLIIAMLILQKWPRGPRGPGIEKDIQLDQKSACNNFLPSEPPPQYEESEDYNRRLAHASLLVEESSQQRNPNSLPPELSNGQNHIIADDDRPLNHPQDVLLDAIEQELQPLQDEEPEEAAAAVPDVDNVGDGRENQDISLYEDSVNLENPIDVNNEGAAVPPGGRRPMQPIPNENNPPFELMLDNHFHVPINWPQFAIPVDVEMPLSGSSSDSGVHDTSINDSMDQIVPNLDSHIENHDTGSAPRAVGRLENLYEGPLSLAVEPFGYSSNDEGFSTDETGGGSSLN